ncbi:MAG TPA: peptidoglycan DD-metalloendopeptidase family protein [Spirochaetota bacterium]|nr:peptidoglycan DD-metalloendopeptidase family protein [Spirochaetota bacterium]HNT10620.1 peptidoglycan DD-metalloendopeptidase family protein [Spirochaetota bacterium]
MKHKGLYPLIALFAALAGAYLLFAKATLSGNPFISKAQGLDDIEKLEDLIIINGLEMSSNRPIDDSPLSVDGSIIYDDEFDAPSQRVKSSESTIASKKSSSPRPAEIMAALKKEDARWRIHKHRIRKGENLWAIAHRYGVSHSLIIRMNEITDPDMLTAGNQISVPSRRDFSNSAKRNVATRAAIAQKTPERHPSAYTGKRPGTRIDGEIARTASPVNDLESDTKDRSSHPEAVRSDRPVRFSLQWPLRGKITSSFGKRTDPFTRKKAFHCGLDISANVGTPIKAASSGRVIFSGWKDGYGKVVIMKHDHGYITVYAHNNKNFVSEGDSVDAGTIIAESGMTGAVTGAHLHFELRKYLTPLNPVRFLR